MPSLATLILQRQIIKRERAAGTYRAESAYIARILATMPLTIFSTLIFGFPIYWMVGLVPTATHYFTFLVILVTHATVASWYGLLISSGSPNVPVGTIIAPTTIVVFLIFGGLLVKLSTVTVALRWIQYLSIIRYTFQALAQNEFLGAVYTCSGGGAICYATGQSVLDQFNLSDISMWGSYGLVWMWGFVFLFVGFFLFENRSRPLMRLQ
jgi:ABC-type multidrug transport system permease subunit